MTRDEAVTLILNRVGQRGGAVAPLDTVLQAQVIEEMKFAQEELETGSQANLAWFLENEYTNATFKTTADVSTVAVPTGFLRELDEERVTLFYFHEDEWVPLTKVDYDEGNTELGGATPGLPQAYTILGLNYRFWPTPDAEYPLKALIYMKDTVLTTNVENNWLKYASRLLIGQTGQAITAFALRDEVAHARFQAMAVAGADALTRDNTARKEAGRARSQGEE